MVKNYRARSFYNAFGHLQPQSRLPGASHMLCPAHRANAFCQYVSHQIEQRSLSADDGDDSALLREWRCFTMFICQTELSPQSDAHFAELIFQKCSERLSSFLKI
jgi:hypothetical protein